MKGDSTMSNLKTTSMMSYLKTTGTMKFVRRLILAGILATLIFKLPVLAQDKEAYQLKIEAPIKTWDVAVPLGNGLTGCLIWGEKNKLRFSFVPG